MGNENETTEPEEKSTEAQASQEIGPPPNRAQRRQRWVTVMPKPDHTPARRKANKVARASRKVNRR
jgi:hypothetical protein